MYFQQKFIEYFISNKKPRHGSVSGLGVIKKPLSVKHNVMSMVLLCRQLPRVCFAKHLAIAKEVWQFLNVRLTAHNFAVRRMTADRGIIAYIFR